MLHNVSIVRAQRLQVRPDSLSRGSKRDGPAGRGVAGARALQEVTPR